MIVLRNSADVDAIPQPGIRQLIRQRLSELELDEPYDRMGELILVEPGDTPAFLEDRTGCWITSGIFGDAKYGEEAFMPSFEWLEHQTDCYEMLFVISDDGFGTVLFVPDSPDIDPELLAFCREYATTDVQAE
jgi:hypothetical protein